MATWHALPPEIQDRILFFFSLGVVHEYENHDPAEFWERTAGRFSQLGKCPTIPTSLISITSALKTCRFFHNSITNVVKLNGQPLVEVLQTLQYRRIVGLIEYYYDSDVEPGIHIGWFVESAGYFWNNPKLIDDKNAIADVLFLISRESRIMFLPHIEPWLIRHAKTVAPDHSVIKLHDANRRKCENPCMDWGVGIYGDDDAYSITLLGNITTFTSVSDKSNNNDDDDDWNFIYACYSTIPLVRDLRNSQPSSWWLYQNNCSSYSPGWILVNYGEKKMYIGPDGTQAYYWENFGHQIRWKRDWYFNEFGHGNSETPYNDEPETLFCNWNHEPLEAALSPQESKINKYQSSESAAGSSTVLKIKKCWCQSVYQKWMGRNVSFEWMY